MGQPIRKLTIICPRDIEAALADALDDMEPPLPRYTVIAANGRGGAMDDASAEERVRGALNMSMFVLVLPGSRIGDVTETIRVTCPRPQIAYWVEPVEDFGQLV